MALNPNIALSVQPIQQPNMLAQYGQIMALRAAQQEIEGYEGVRSDIAGGMSPTDQRMLRHGPRGVAAYKAASEVSARDVETQTKSLKAIKENVGSVNSPEAMLDYLKGAYSTPGGVLLAKLVPFDKAVAAIPREPKAFEEYKKNFSLTADKLFTSADAELRAKVDREGHGVQIRGQNISAQTAANRLKFDQEKQDVIEGQGEFIRKDAYGNLYRVEGYGTMRGPNAPVAAPTMSPAAANAFVTTRPSVNAFAPTAPPQVVPGSPTVANAAAIEAQQNVPKPKVPIRQPVAVMKDGKAVLVPPEQAVGMPPATAFAEKTAEDKAQTARNINTAISNLTEVTKPGGLLEKSTGSGAGKLRDVAYGFVGKATEGGIAAAKLAPIADLVLKMVPRFEGPQSDKDTQSYREAAGQLADSSLPNEIRAGAAKVILDLMKARRDEFQMTDRVGGGGGNVIDFGSLK